MLALTRSLPELGCQPVGLQLLFPRLSFLVPPFRNYYYLSSHFSYLHLFHREVWNNTFGYRPESVLENSLLSKNLQLSLERENTVLSQGKHLLGKKE